MSELIVDGRPVTAPETRERRLMERVYLRDVAAAIPEALVDVVARMEIAPETAQTLRIENLVVLDADDYLALKRLGTLRRVRPAAPVPAAPVPEGPAPAAAALDALRDEAANCRVQWDASRRLFEGAAQALRNAGLDASDACAHTERLAAACAQAVRDFSDLVARIDALHQPPEQP